MSGEEYPAVVGRGTVGGKGGTCKEIRASLTEYCRRKGLLSPRRHRVYVRGEGSAKSAGSAKEGRSGGRTVGRSGGRAGKGSARGRRGG